MNASSWVLAVTLLLPAAASAQGSARERLGRRHFQTAERHYARGRFLEAFREYETAYAIAPLPALLFNMGQCQRKLGARERAVSFYRRYLEEVPDAENREIVEGLVEELAPGPAAAESSPVGATAPRIRPGPEDRETREALGEAPERPASSAVSSRRRVSVGTAAVLGAGIALLSTSGSLAAYVAKDEADRGTAASFQAAALWTGAGVLAAGVVLLFVDLAFAN